MLGGTERGRQLGKPYESESGELGKVTPRFWKPRCVTQLSTPPGGGARSSGRERMGMLVAITWEAEPASTQL